MPKFADRFIAGRPAGVSLVSKDANGRLIQWVENGFTVSVTRNAAGKPTSVTARMPGAGAIVWGFEYDASGNFVRQSGDQIPTVFKDEILNDVHRITLGGEVIGGNFGPWLLEGRPDGSPFMQKVEGLPMPGGTSRTLLNVQGRGYVGSIFLASMAKIGTVAMDRVLNQRVEFYFDGSATPQYSCTLARLLCAEYMGTYTATPFRSDYVGASHLGGGDADNTAISHAISGVNKMCFPFRTGLVIVLRNNGPAGSGDVHSIFSCISGVVGLPETDFTKWRLRISDGVYTSPTISAANNNNLPGQEQVLTMLQVPAGTRGRYFGLYHCLDGANVVDAVNNVKLSPLEGNHKIYLNNPAPVIGTTAPTLEWSGSEDYIGEVGWFGGPAAFATTEADAIEWKAAVGKYSGLTLLNEPWQGLFAGYRWHVPDPVVFDNGMTLTWNVGDYAQRAWTGSCRVTWAAFWYEWVG